MFVHRFLSGAIQFMDSLTHTRTHTHYTRTPHAPHTHTTHTCNPGEKKFECLEDLVQDGLITLYLQQHNAGLTMQRGRVVVRHKSQRQTRLKRKSARWVPSPLVVCRQCCYMFTGSRGRKSLQNHTHTHTHTHTPLSLSFIFAGSCGGSIAVWVV